MPAPAVLLLLLVSILLAGEAPPGVALAQRGMAFSGPARIVERGVTVAGTTLAWADLAVAALPGRPAAILDAGVVTRQGEVLRGLPLGIEQDALLFAGDLHGELRLPLSSLSAIALSPIAPAALLRLVGPEAAVGAVLGNGERQAGTLNYLNAEAVGIDTGRRVAQMPRARVAAVVLAAVQPPPPTGRTWLAVDSGDRLAVQALALAPAGLAVDGPLGRAVLPPARLMAVWNDHGRIRHLAATTPARILAADRIGAALPVRPGEGFPGAFGGLAAAAGVLLPARGEISWGAEGFAVLLAWAACPADSLPVVARIDLDGSSAWEQTLQPGAPAVAVALPLKNAREVALRALPGADGDTASRTVAWCHPLLVK